MITFFDTNVLISACQVRHTHHEAGLTAFAAARKSNAVCGLHSIAEIYAVTTGMPAPFRIAPRDIQLFLRQVEERCHLISLTASEYMRTTETLAEAGHTGGIIYDALLLASARKSKADRILTWNIRHFRRLAPDLTDRIMTP